MRSLALSLVLALLHPIAAIAAPRNVAINNESLGQVRVLAPDTEPNRFVVFISDHDGVTPVQIENAERLVARGAAVALVDLPTVRAKMAEAAADEECFYTFGDVEDLARNAQRELRMTTWRWPIMFGTGEGGTFAYLLLAQAPDNTAGGAISLGFSPNFASPRPLCPGAPKVSVANTGIHYAPMTDVPGPWAVILPSGEHGNIEPFTAVAKGSTILTVTGSEGDRYAAAVDALFKFAPSNVAGLSDLPLIELPVTGKPKSVFILISGDGGWRDIDKQIGEALAKADVAVIGVDSLRYFWSRKEPKQIAADLTRMADYAATKWDVKTLGWGGYSFGADALPLAWPFMAKDAQERTKLIALLGLETTADLQISVTGFLGIADSNDIPIAPHLARLPPGKTMCFYGEQEAADGDTACTAKELDGATRVKRPGGHHFDGAFEPVAQAILERLNSP